MTTDISQQTIGFIGAGNMASSILGGLLASGHPADKLAASEPNLQRHQQATLTGVALHTDNLLVAEQADILVLAIKPQVMREVCQQLADTIQQHRPLIISIAAGIRSQSLTRWLGDKAAIVRVMPNTPALINQGMSTLYANTNVSDSQRNFADAIMSSVGDAVWLNDEDQLDAVTAVSGSGPAYYFLFMEAMIEAAIKQGLDPELAAQLVKKTALGAATMAGESVYTPETLRKQVTSPGGTTERALQILNEGQLAQLIDQAIEAATQRSIELSEQLDQDEE